MKIYNETKFTIIYLKRNVKKQDICYETKSYELKLIEKLVVEYGTNMVGAHVFKLHCMFISPIYLFLSDSYPQFIE